MNIECFVAYVTHFDFRINPDLTAHILPSAAESVVLTHLVLADPVVSKQGTTLLIGGRGYIELSIRVLSDNLLQLFP